MIPRLWDHLQLNLHYSISGAAKVMFTYKCDFLLLKALILKSKKGRLAQNVLHVGKVHVIRISCLYPCLLYMYFIVPTLNFKHAFSWPRSNLSKVKGKELRCKTIHKGWGEASLLPWTPFTLLTHPKSPFPCLPRCDTEQSPESLWVLRKSRDVCHLIDHSQKVIGSCVMIQIFHQSNFRIPDHLESKLINCSNCPKVLKSVFQGNKFGDFQGCALTKIEESPVLWTCEIQCAQHMICIKKLKFSSRREQK